jgi:Rrf2 family protein
MRLGITRKTDLALQVLRALASDAAAPRTASDLAAAVAASAAYLPQVMAPLVRAGWVTSMSGPHGGYRLGADPRRLSVLQVVEALEGPIFDGRCVVIGSRCSDASPCVLHHHWLRAQEVLIAELDSIPVCDCPRPPGVPPAIEAAGREPATQPKENAP